VGKEIAYAVIGVQMSALTSADCPFSYLIAPAAGESIILPVRFGEGGRQQQQEQ
jgi:hypothetical protein